MKKVITAEIINPEAIQYASEEFTKLLFEFYIEAKEVETKEGGYERNQGAEAKVL